MNWRELPDRVRQAIRRAPKDAVFLCGAGISVDGGLPTAWEFHTGLAAYVGETTDERSTVLELLTTCDSTGGTRPLRFEQTLTVLRETYDPWLSVLKCFHDGDLEPSPLSEAIASALQNGAIAVTTNFDCFIERAVDATVNSHAFRQLYTARATKDPRNRLTAANVRPGTLLKLHGTMRARRRRGHTVKYAQTTASLGATLDAIGRATTALGLEINKDSALRAAMQGRYIIVIGYSGSDDFDVVPSLRIALRDAQGLVWIKHESGVRNRFVVRSSRGRIPNELQEHAAKTAVLVGDSKRAAEWLLRTTLSARLVSRPDISQKIAELPRYRRLVASQRTIIAGRLAEMAGRPVIALREYRASIKRSRQPSRVQMHAHAYALSRIGHLERERGHNTAASRALSGALEIARRYRFPTLRANVLVSLGNIALRSGELDQALKLYRTAYQVNRRLSARGPRHRQNKVHLATIANNIGIAMRKRGDHKNALRMFTEALNRSQRLRNRDIMVLALANIGNVQYQIGNYDSAAQFYDRAIGLARELGRWQGVVINLSNLAAVYRAQGRVQEAHPLLAEAISMCRVFPHPEAQVNALLERAKNRFARKLRHLTLKDLDNAEPIAHRIRHVEALCDILALRSELESLSGNTRAAVKHKRESQRFARQLR